MCPRTMAVGLSTGARRCSPVRPRTVLADWAGQYGPGAHRASHPVPDRTGLPPGVGGAPGATTGAHVQVGVVRLSARRGEAAPPSRGPMDLLRLGCQQILEMTDQHADLLTIRQQIPDMVAHQDDLLTIRQQIPDMMAHRGESVRDADPDGEMRGPLGQSHPPDENRPPCTPGVTCG